MTASLLKSLGLFSVFWPFSIILKFEWSLLVLLFPSPLSLFNNPSATVTRGPIMIAVYITFMFHRFFNSLARSRYLSFFSLSFNFTPLAAGTAKLTFLQVVFFFC